MTADYLMFGKEHYLVDGANIFHRFGGNWGYFRPVNPANHNYIRQRWYDSLYGQWLSKDPFGRAGGENLYQFIENNAVTWTDPSGLSQDPMPGAPGTVVRISVALFIPMAAFEFVAPFRPGIFEGDGRGFSSNSHRFRLQGNYILDICTGERHRSGASNESRAFVTVPGNPPTQQWFQGNPEPIVPDPNWQKVSLFGKTSWNGELDVSGSDALYDLGKYHFAPPARVKIRVSIDVSEDGRSIEGYRGTVDYANFPSVEIWTYGPGNDSTTMQWGYMVPENLQNGHGPLTLLLGLKNTVSFGNLTYPFR